jgi:hypothetical protein
VVDPDDLLLDHDEAEPVVYLVEGSQISTDPDAPREVFGVAR